MKFHLLSRLGALGSVGFTGYVLGILVERSAINNTSGSKVKKFPALPLFGSVSAATPMTTNSSQVNSEEVTPISKNRVGQVNIINKVVFNTF